VAGPGGCPPRVAGQSQGLAPTIQIAQGCCAAWCRGSSARDLECRGTPGGCPPRAAGQSQGLAPTIQIAQGCCAPRCRGSSARDLECRGTPGGCPPRVAGQSQGLALRFRSRRVVAPRGAEGAAPETSNVGAPLVGARRAPPGSHKAWPLRFPRGARSLNCQYVDSALFDFRTRGFAGRLCHL